MIVSGFLLAMTFQENSMLIVFYRFFEILLANKIPIKWIFIGNKNPIKFQYRAGLVLCVVF